MLINKNPALAAFSALLLAACTNDQTEQEVSDESLAAATASLPDTDILLGEFEPAEGAPFAITNITKAIAEPGYQNQPMFLGPNQGRFYFVAEGASGKTDIWVYDVYSGEKFQLTDTPEKSEYSPKPAPGNRLSFIQESEDGEMTRVHALKNEGDPGEAVIQFGPLGYYEWLNGGETLGVFYRSEPPELHLVDVAKEETREIFANAGRGFQASPDGKILYVTQSDEDGRQRIMRVDVESGNADPLGYLPGQAQDYSILFNREGAPEYIISSEGSKILVRHAGDHEDWRLAADISHLGYEDITRIAIGYSEVIIDGDEELMIALEHMAIVASPQSDQSN